MIKNVDNNGNVHNVTSIRKPRKWRRYEYLESSGTLWIDTGYVPNNSTTFTVDMAILNGGDRLNGCIQGASGRFHLGILNLYFLGGVGSNYNNYGEKDTNRHVFSISGDGTIKIDNSTYTSGTIDTLIIPLFIFARNTLGTASCFITGKCYSSLIYENNQLVRDFVPAEYNGLYGLWDLVQDKFYGNLGTGSFTVGPEIKNYEEVEEVRKVGRLLPVGLELYNYILSSGTLWINTLYKPNNNTRIICDFQFTTSKDCPRIFGCSSGTGWNSTPNFQLNFETGVATGKLGVIIGNNNSWTRTNITGDFNRHTYDLATTRLIYDGTQVATYPDQTFQCTTNLPIFVHIRSNINVQLNEFAIGKLYSFQIYESNELVRNFLPCTYLEEPGLWDTVENRFYRNSGSGSFTLGSKITLELYEYLKLEGNYLDTGFIPNLNTRVQAELLLYNQDTTALFGSRSNTNDLAFVVWNGAQEKLSFLYGNISYTEGMFNPTPATNTKFIIDLNKNIGTLNNGATVVYNLSTFSSNCSFLIGTTNSNGTVDSRYTKENVYWFKIWDNDILIRDYIPCTYNGSPGLWDKLNWKFYGNSGSGSFVVTNKVSSSKIYYKRIRPFTIESTEDSNSITLTYINELEDKTGYPTQVEADVWVDGAAQPTLVIIPMNTETTIANLDNGHKARVFIHNHNLQNSHDDGVRISFGSADEFKAYGDLSSLLEDTMPSYRWVGLFRESKVNDLHNLILPEVVNTYDYASFCMNCTCLADASFKLPTITNGATLAFILMFRGCSSLVRVPGKIHLFRTQYNRYEINTSMCREMFYECTSLVNTPEIDSDYIAANGCSYMFYGCTSLTTMPKLENISFGGESCYAYMFYGCTNLVNVYKLPTTTLTKKCYSYMFYGCTSLRTIPKDMLPAMTIAQESYANMFLECTNLTNVPDLPATTLGASCYISMFYRCLSLSYVPINLLPATTATSGCYRAMFCYTSITTAPNLPATTVGNNSYHSMFYGCSKLVNVPSLLPAMSLVSYCYLAMFYNCTSLKHVPTNFLPATTMAHYCYHSMFRGCTSLVSIPNLPATTLSTDCYEEMFYDCISIITPPVLLATTLYDFCYKRMFRGCTSLTVAPLLPAMSVLVLSYAYMFYGCTSLIEAPTLPATTISNLSYYQMFYNCSSLEIVPSILPAMTVGDSSYYGMFQNCTSLTNAPDLPATTLANNCYYYMFRGCKSLTNAPHILPAMTLFRECYYEMFYGTAIEIAPVLPAVSFAAKYNCYNGMFRNCKQLKWVKALFTTQPTTSYTANWLNDLPNTSTQIFVKNENATWTDRGVHSIPTKWTVQTCEEDNYSYPNSL